MRHTTARAILVAAAAAVALSVSGAGTALAGQPAEPASAASQYTGQDTGAPAVNEVGSSDTPWGPK